MTVEDMTVEDMTAVDAVLATDGLTVRFGGLTAVAGVSMQCRRGELTGLIGPNGAGKTTFIDAVTGFLPKNASGKVLLDGEDVTGWAPHHLAHAGLTRTWQTLELFDDITVRSNLDVPAGRLTVGSAVRDYFSRRTHSERVDEVIELLEMGDIVDRQPRELSQGQRKLVGVARALAADSKVVLLDEPAAGLDKSETEWFGEHLRRLIDEGITMMLVDHDMGLVLNVCDRIYTLVFGELIASGTPEETRNNPDVISAYLGHSGGSQ